MNIHIDIVLVWPVPMSLGIFWNIPNISTVERERKREGEREMEMEGEGEGESRREREGEGEAMSQKKR